MPANLLLHCGAHAVTRAVLESIPTPRATRTWRPVPHAGLLRSVEETLDRHRLAVIGQAHGLTHDGSRYFGLIEVRPRQTPVSLAEDRGYTRVVGIRNSHDKSLPAGLVAGSQVFVCDNLAFFGEIRVTRKHTRFIMRDLVQALDDAVQRLDGMWDRHDRRVDVYRGYELPERQAHDLTILAHDAGVYPATRIPSVLTAWREPAHADFEPRTLWSWFNGVTECLKDNLAQLPARTGRLHQLCDGYVGLN